ncbi:hypothetical protein MTR_3g071780 [Medicago truncatula]|uniref:Uncharacterized protein n=1 Tax=Medicago truncatula TaxID=3880 RepID=A0A072UZF1_MEDTR|nr:hypothetical protein MTR_3g071780 [Medicago truncatula]
MAAATGTASSVSRIYVPMLLSTRTESATKAGTTETGSGTELMKKIFNAIKNFAFNMSVYVELPNLTGKKNQTEIGKKAWESGSKHIGGADPVEWTV